MKKRLALLGISFSLLAGLIYFSNPWKVAGTLLKANPLFIALGLLFWFVGCLVRSYRWQYLLKKVDIHVPFLRTIKYYVAGLFISNLSPMKTADPVRAVFLKKSEDESFSKGVASIFMGRIFDIITICIISLLGIFLLAASYDIVRWVAIAVGIYIFLIILGIYLTYSKRLESFLNKLISIFSFLPKIDKVRGRAEEFSRKLRSGIKRYRSKKTLLVTFLFSLGIWLLNACIAWTAFLSLGFEAPFIVILTVKTAGILIAFLTLLPGSLGSGEIIGVGLYTAFLEVGVSNLTSVVILGRLINFWVYAVVGAILLMTFKKEVLSL